MKTALTDGNVTAIEGDALKEGDEVILGLATAKAMANSGGGGAVAGRVAWGGCRWRTRPRPSRSSGSRT